MNTRTRTSTDKQLAKEAQDWDSGKLNPRDWQDAPEALPRVSASTPISLRLPTQMLAILREMARREGVGYQVLMKRWLDERIKEERDKLVAQQKPRPARKSR